MRRTYARNLFLPIIAIIQTIPLYLGGNFVKTAIAHKCARISYSLQSEYEYHFGKRFKYGTPDDWVTNWQKDGNTCSLECEKNLAASIKTNLPVSAEPAAAVINSPAYLWAVYKTNPDVCEADSGLCITSSSHQRHGENCTCGLILSQMRIHKIGSRNVGGQTINCTYDDVKSRFESRFSATQFGIKYDRQWSKRQVHCAKQYDTCDCNKGAVCDVL